MFMKKKHLGTLNNRNIADYKKKSASQKFLKGFCVFVLMFTALWLYLLLCPDEYIPFLEVETVERDELSVAETMTVVLIVGVTLGLGFALSAFFCRQIVHIYKSSDAHVQMIMCSGKIITIELNSIVSITQTRNRYIVRTQSKRYIAYKYMPPNPFAHCVQIREEFERLDRSLQLRTGL